MLWVAAVLAGLAVLARGRRDTGRLDRAVPPRAAPRPGAGAAPPRAGHRGPVGRVGQPALASAAGGAALALLLPTPTGLVLGLAVAVAGPRLLGRLEPAQERARRGQLAADLPLLLDLLASCLAGGAPLPEAARAVAAAVPGPAGERLGEVSAQLSVGTPPAQAWALLTGGLPVSGPGADPLAPAARALGRAAEGGAPVAEAVARLAADARAQARAQGEQSARRVGVLVVAPLGLCFLPAFVLLGVVPVVAGLVGPLLATL